MAAALLAFPRLIPETPGELYGRARIREAEAAARSAEGLYREAATHWAKAEAYRFRAALIEQETRP